MRAAPDDGEHIGKEREQTVRPVVSQSEQKPALFASRGGYDCKRLQLGIVASWERQRIVERTAAGRDQAKARGVKFGRRAALTPHQQAEALQRLAKGDTQRTVAALLGVDQATISRLARGSAERP